MEPFRGRAAWDQKTLADDSSWVVEFNESHRLEITDALATFKQWADHNDLTAQWLYGNVLPTPENFPLPTVGPLLNRAALELEDGYGLAMFRGFPVDGWAAKDLHLLNGGVCGYIGTPRPQTVFGALAADLRDEGQGTNHSGALSFHTDPCDVHSLLCVEPAESGGIGTFASSVTIHDALLATTPQHVETLYKDFFHAILGFAFVRTGSNEKTLPKSKYFTMPIFTAEKGKFASKYSRFLIDKAQTIAGVPGLTAAQLTALEALEAEMANPNWQFEISYTRGDLVLMNNYVGFHGRTSFNRDDPEGPSKRHMIRLWLSTPNSRALSPAWLKQPFYNSIGAGEVRGGLNV